MKRQINYETYVAKIHGGWMGKSIGGIIGAAAENQKTRLAYTRDTLWPEKIWPNDDLDIQVVWLEVMEERGVWLTHQDLVEYWQDRCWYNFCEYGFFLHNAQRGIMPPVSGWWNNRFFRESEGCPIRSEIWGLVAPGNPELAAQYARRDGELDHAGNSVWSEMFLAGAAAEAFFENDLQRVLRAGLATIPADCAVARMVGTVVGICQRYPDWNDAWRVVIRQYGHRDASKAITNQALVVMALVLGQGDFARTMLLACNSGWDTDCTAATAGALLGIMSGIGGLPAEWVGKMGQTLACDVAVKHRTSSFEEVVADTARVGVEMARLRNDRVEITGAPDVRLRTQPAPAVAVSVEYPEDPVLWRQRPTPVDLVLTNPHATAVAGVLRVEATRTLEVGPMERAITLAPGQQHRQRIEVRQRGGVIWDKNLLVARWKDNTGRETATGFGLGGARQWLVYGPYWDMWDTQKNAVCPYNNPELIICPNRLPDYGGDAWNHYVRLDRAYLDEQRLLREDLPAELPVSMERGQDYLDGKHLAGFVGPAAFYLVRQIVAPAPLAIHLMLGADAPVVVWFDDREIFRRAGPRCWAPQDVCLPVTVGPEPKRLVVKLARASESLTFSVFPAKRDIAGNRTVGHSMVLDILGDQPAALT